MQKDYFSTIEASKILGISRVQVFRRIRSGQLKAEKVGRNFIVHSDQIRQALGKKLGEERKRDIEKAVDKAIREYGEVFKKLGKE